MFLHSKTKEKNMIHWNNYRFSVITDRIIRFEYCPLGTFEDRATQVVLNRNFFEPSFVYKENDHSIEIYTDSIRLVFQKEEGGFNQHNLKIEVIGNYSEYHGVWHFGEKFETLKGTARTLDWADGEIPLEEGLMSRNGFSVLNDSNSLVLNNETQLENRGKGIQDYYFFGFGRDYLGTLKEFFKLTGEVPLIPRYALGNWWSRYHKYSSRSYQQLIEKFQEKNIPFSVCVIDMDWHLTDIPPQYGSGWTGYTWNRELFPDPKAFISWLHDQGMHVSLNLHPANGIQPHEEMYEVMGQELGVNIANKEPILFDVTNEEFLDAYFKHIIHPNEEIGVDFWWIDWQSGNVSQVEGLDPLWILNHYHYIDHQREGKLGLIFSRYAGIGSHRYPIGFSGDTLITWKSLKFQPYFTATASNVGYSWWSHDIEGHMEGIKDNELFIRWLQFGVFSPINRLHSTNGPFYSKEPWRYPPYEEEVISEFLRLRHRLVPYLHTMNYLTHEDSFPLVQPMYYQYPWKEEAYKVPNQYLFGTQLLVAPITKKSRPITKRAQVKVWLPEGVWFDFFTGKPYHGNRMLKIHRKIDQIPVFVKQGGIVPLAIETENELDNPKNLKINIYPGANGSFTLQEDETYKREHSERKKVQTKFEFKWRFEAGKSLFKINPAKGDTSILPKTRNYYLHFPSMTANKQMRVLVDKAEHKVESKTTSEEVVIVIEDISPESEVVIELHDTQIAVPDLEKEMFDYLDEVILEHKTKEVIFDIVRQQKKKIDIISSIASLDLPKEINGNILEIISAY